MKNLLLTLALILGSVQASARSILPSILVFKEVPAQHVVLENRDLKSIAVYANGDVRAFLGGKVVYSSRVSSARLNYFYELLEDAAHGKLVRDPKGAFCFTSSPIENLFIGGSSGETILARGHFCNGNVFENDSEAAKILIRILQQLIAEAFPQR